MNTITRSLTVSASVVVLVLGFAIAANAGWGNGGNGGGGQSRGSTSSSSGAGNGSGAGRTSATQVDATTAFTNTDLNKDGQVTRDEFLGTDRPGRGANSVVADTTRATRFDAADADHDGKLNATEFATLHTTR